MLFAHIVQTDHSLVTATSTLEYSSNTNHVCDIYVYISYQVIFQKMCSYFFSPYQVIFQYNVLVQVIFNTGTHIFTSFYKIFKNKHLNQILILCILTSYKLVNSIAICTLLHSVPFTSDLI